MVEREHGAPGSPGQVPSEPDDGLSRAARDLAQRVSPVFLFNHAVRSYAWAYLLGQVEAVVFDEGLLYVAALLHDVGLTDAFRGQRCFEHESAAAAAQFCREHGWPEHRCNSVAEAIRLHMQPRVVVEDGPEAYLLTEATGCDVTGYRLGDLPGPAVADVLQRYPRLDFAPGFIDLFEREARDKPGCMADLYLQRGLADRARTAPFAAAWVPGAEAGPQPR